MRGTNHDSLYAKLADSLARGGWTSSTTHPDWGNGKGGREASRDDMKIAALVDIMISLRAIRSVLECENTRKMAVAARSIERLLRVRLPERKKKPAVKPKRRRPK